MCVILLLQYQNDFPVFTARVRVYVFVFFITLKKNWEYYLLIRRSAKDTAKKIHHLKYI